MSRRKVHAGVTSLTVPIFIRDTSSTTGAGLGSIIFNTASLAGKYRRQGDSAWTTINLVTATVGTFTSGGFVADGGPVTGGYEVGIPDAAMAAGGARWVEVVYYGAANMLPVLLEFELDAIDYQDAVRAGLTALPNANAEAAGGLYTRGTGAGQVNQDANGRLDVNLKAAAGTAVTLDANNVLNVSAKYLAGTSLTARDVGASVLLSAGTGAGQLDFTSGVVKANLAQILGTAITETAGQIAAAFKKFFDVATPTTTLNAVSTYAGADTAGTTTLLSRITGAVPLAGDYSAARAAKLDNLDNLDAAISTRSTLAAGAAMTLTAAYDRAKTALALSEYTAPDNADIATALGDLVALLARTDPTSALAAVKAVTDVLSPLISAGAFTAAALANAPSGGVGGSSAADVWNYLLSAMTTNGSIGKFLAGLTPADTIDANLTTVLGHAAQVDAAGLLKVDAVGAAGTGSGPLPMVVHVTDAASSADLPASAVAVYSAAGSLLARDTTGDAGRVTLGLSAGAVTVIASRRDYGGRTGAQTVLSGGTWQSSGTGTLAVPLTAVAVPAPASAGQATVYAYAMAGDGSPLERRKFALRLVAANTSHDLWSGDVYWSGESDSTGLATATAELGGSYQASLDGVEWTDTFTVGATPYHLTEIVGAFRSGCRWK